MLAHDLGDVCTRYQVLLSDMGRRRGGPTDVIYSIDNCVKVFNSGSQHVVTTSSAQSMSNEEHDVTEKLVSVICNYCSVTSSVTMSSGHLSQKTSE